VTTLTLHEKSIFRLLPVGHCSSTVSVLFIEAVFLSHLPLSLTDSPKVAGALFFLASPALNPEPNEAVVYSILLLPTIIFFTSNIKINVLYGLSSYLIQNGKFHN
jgi:hypothetical protein